MCSCAVGVILYSLYQSLDKVLFHHDSYKYQVCGYDKTLFIGQQHPIPKKSNPWFDEEWREALKARRALDERVEHSRELRGETISAFRRSQAKARQLFNQKKRQSWAEYVSKLSAKTPIKHVWDRVRKISGKNICPPKQSLNGKNGTTITDQTNIAKEHAAVFTDNSSSAQYSATFQAIKEQEERVKIDFQLRQHRCVQQTLPIESFEVINHES